MTVHCCKGHKLKLLWCFLLPMQTNSTIDHLSPFIFHSKRMDDQFAMVSPIICYNFLVQFGISAYSWRKQGSLLKTWLC